MSDLFNESVLKTFWTNESELCDESVQTESKLLGNKSVENDNGFCNIIDKLGRYFRF